MESSILSEVDDTPILRTGLPLPLWPSSQLATGLSPLAPRSGLERSDFVHWHIADDGLAASTFRKGPESRHRGTDLGAEVVEIASPLCYLAMTDI